jgi:REP element-mobilizing transposase RayT
VGALKSKSASAVLDHFGPVNEGKHSRTFWSSGFFLCSVGGATLEILQAYIENQAAKTALSAYPPLTEGLRGQICSFIAILGRI